VPKTNFFMMLDRVAGYAHACLVSWAMWDYNAAATSHRRLPIGPQPNPRFAPPIIRIVRGHR
jgi:hypothetical protein